MAEESAVTCAISDGRRHRVPMFPGEHTILTEGVEHVYFGGGDDHDEVGVGDESCPYDCVLERKLLSHLHGVQVQQHDRVPGVRLDDCQLVPEVNVHVVHEVCSACLCA